MRPLVLALACFTSGCAAIWGIEESTLRESADAPPLETPDAPLAEPPDAAPPEVPDAAPVVPDATPPKPDATPPKPDATPPSPDAASAVPDAPPAVPDATPAVPDATLAAPDAGADAPLAEPDATPPPVDAGLPDGGFTQPSGTIAVSFIVDDRANQVYGPGDLRWKGSMLYHALTRTITYDPAWGSPWPPLYDDGPWDKGSPPGHEPKGAVAGDHKWGITVFVTPPTTGSAQSYEYGLTDASYDSKFDSGWCWIGNNGQFAVKAGDTAITAKGQTFPAFGTTDLQLTIDTTALDASHTWDTSVVGVKGSAWSWGLQTLTVDGNGKATFTMSNYVGAGHTFDHTGLLSSGQNAEFVFTFTGVEYKDGGVSLATGITAAVKAAGASGFTPVPIMLNAFKNTYITAP
jgi:hypothetical protein